MNKIQDLRAAYGWLKAFAASVPEAGNIPGQFIEDYQRIHAAVERALGKPLGDFSPASLRQWQGGGGTNWCDAASMRSRALQLTGFLEAGYNVEDKVIAIGSLFKAIHDPVLQERCGDLIMADNHFDRVINQATLVLEDRIRMRSGLEKTLVGSNLVNAAIRADPNDSIIVFSDIRSEQEGYANIVRGLMQALRNETHHTVVDTFTREDSLSICGFIDRILRLIDSSAVRK